MLNVVDNPVSTPVVVEKMGITKIGRSAKLDNVVITPGEILTMLYLSNIKF